MASFKKNTAVTGFPIGHFINATTGATVTTGTPTCKRILDGTGAALTNAAAYNSDAALWEIDLAAGDTNGDMVGFSFALTDCLPIAYGFRTGTKLVSELNDAVTAPTASQIQTELEENGASILDTLRDDLADGGRLDLLIDAIKAKTDGLNFTGTDVKATLDSETVDLYAGATTWFVRKTGNDSYAGHSELTAKLTVAAAKTAAAEGDIIDLGPGVFTENVTSYDKPRLHYRGAGLGTQMTSATGTTLEVGDYTIVENMRVTSTSTSTNEWPLLCYNISAGTGRTGVTLRKVYLDGVFDGGMFYKTTDLRLEDVTLRGKYDGANLRYAANWYAIDSTFYTDCTYNAGGQYGSGVVAEYGYGLARNCIFYGYRNDATDKDTYAFRTKNGQYLLDNCQLLAVQAGAGSGNVSGVAGPNDGGVFRGSQGDITITGGQVYTSNAGTGANYSLWRYLGTLAVGPDTYYDATKTSGTITQTAGLADVKTQIGTAGAGLTAIPTIATVTTVTTVGTTTNLTNLPAIPTDWLAAAGVKADAVTKIQAGLSTHSAADVKTAIEAAGGYLALILEDTGTTLPATLTTIGGYVGCLPASWVTVPTAAEVVTAMQDTGTVLAKLLTMIVQDGAVWDLTAASLAAAPSGTGASAVSIREEIDANSTQLAAIVEDTGTTLPDAIEAIGAGSGATAAEVWANATRTLTGSAGTTGPTAQTQDADAYVTCPKGGTVALSKRVSHIGGTYITQATVSTITYSIFALDPSDEGTRTAVAGHQAVALVKTAVVWDTLQTDLTATNWNLRHIVDVSTYAAFTEVGTTYLVEYTITPTSGQVIVTRVRVRCE